MSTFLKHLKPQVKNVRLLILFSCLPARRYASALFATAMCLSIRLLHPVLCLND